MTHDFTPLYLQPGWDCLLLVHPYIQILERTSNEIIESGIQALNISKELSIPLMSVLVNERGRFTQKWLADALTSFNHSPVLCISPDLLFDPSLEIDPLTLFRQAAKIIRMIVLWPGDFDGKTLSYAVPEHHHYRTWKIPDSLTQQPIVMIQRIIPSQGA